MSDLRVGDFFATEPNYVGLSDLIDAYNIVSQYFELLLYNAIDYTS